MRRLVCFFTLLCMLMLVPLTLTGCGGSELVTFTWQVDSMPKSLDPQLAESVSEQTAAEHLFRGLMMLDDSGQPVVDCAENYTISADKCTYTFTLKDDLYFYSYDDEQDPIPLTAQDFVFGITRVFLPDTFSPYAQQLSSIAQSAEVLNGGDPGLLGVSAPDDKTVVIRLSAPDETFLSKLCCPGAMPCNEEFFRSTKGSYGLSEEQVLTNGDFYLYNWTTQGLFLRRKNAPAGAANNLRLVLQDAINPAVSLQELADDTVSGIEYRGEAPEGYAAYTFQDTVWAIIFNCKQKDFANLSIRQAIASVLSESLGQQQPLSTLHSANGLLVPALPLPNGEHHDADVSTSFGDSLSLYQQGLAELQKSKLSDITVLLPDDPSILQAFETSNQQLQKELSAFFSLKAMPESELNDLVSKGEFSIALVPLSPKTSDCSEFLQQLAVLAGYPDTASLTALQDVSLSASQRSQLVLQAEQELLQQAVLVPTWFEERCFLTKEGWSGIIYSPFGPRLNLRNAVLC